jgi:hypothetical protein
MSSLLRENPFVGGVGGKINISTAQH